MSLSFQINLSEGNPEKILFLAGTNSNFSQNGRNYNIENCNFTKLLVTDLTVGSRLVDSFEVYEQKLGH